MELVSFSVSNFRSITSAYKLPIRRPTVLIGPNNEGKSNILRAMVASLQFLSLLGGVRLRHDRITSVVRPRDIYDWARDFPVSLQARNPDGETVFDMEFRLSGEEIEQFRTDVKSNLNGNLPVQLRFGSGETRLIVPKQGKGGAALTSKAQTIARFVARHINFAYIPAVRTASAAIEIVNDLVDRELSRIETQPEYTAAINALAELQRPVLSQIADSIKTTLGEFLPNVKAVEVQITTAARYRALRRSCEIVIDDGTATPLDKKGDGVQSLAALSLMKHASHSGSSGRNLVLAIEEPESHLHPKAIHQLRDVLEELSGQHQVILTTHCPLFVDRSNLRSNILVNKKRASPAKTIAELRDILGVRASDNLRNAEIALVVEGEEDRKALLALLPAASKRIGTSLQTGLIAIDTLGGGTNLSYKLSQLRETLCVCHSFLDNDKAGAAAISKAEAEGLLLPADVTQAICPGLDESEFEDMLDEGLYAQFILNKYGASLSSPKFKGKRKWSDRLRSAFEHQGKAWSGKLEAQIKNDVADLAVASPTKALNAHKKGAFEGLVVALEAKIDLIERGKT
ncbi:ATP-binding protein [Ralstonia pseudosolanacearum]|uniref:ATP-dependent nuclease n=2 Tax=Pseudomonadota TaxID=1224 RepID=UPI002E1D3682